GLWEVGNQLHAHDLRLVRRILVKAHRAVATRQVSEILHALHHASDQRDVAIKLARGLADHRIKFGAGTGIGCVVAAGADHAVAVHQPSLSGFWIAPDRKALAET